MRKKLTIKNARKVFDNILELDNDILKDVLIEINGALNNLRDLDMFGTEGQLDPRGDRREDNA